MFSVKRRSQVGCRHATPLYNPSVDSYTVNDPKALFSFLGERYIWAYSGGTTDGPCIQSTHPSNIQPPSPSFPLPPPLLCTTLHCKASRMYLHPIRGNPCPVLLVNLRTRTSALPTSTRKNKCCSPGREEGIGDATRTTRARRRESWPHTTRGPTLGLVSHICFHGRIGN